MDRVHGPWTWGPCFVYVLETLIKHDAQVFEIASQLRLGNEEEMAIFKKFHILSAEFLLTEQLYCYGDLPFQLKGC